MLSALRAAGLVLLAAIAVSCAAGDSPSGPTPISTQTQSQTPAPPDPPRETTSLYSGIVTDGQGRPVVGATVRGGPNSGITDANGRYEFRSPYDRVPGNVYPPAGYERKPVYYSKSFPLSPGGQNISIRRITSVTMSPPATLKVGAVASMAPRITFDTGQVESPIYDYFERTVSDPTVLKFSGGFGAMIEGVKPGTATVTGKYFGASAGTAQIEVAP